MEVASVETQTQFFLASLSLQSSQASCAPGASQVDSCVQVSHDSSTACRPTHQIDREVSGQALPGQLQSSVTSDLPSTQAEPDSNLTQNSSRTNPDSNAESVSNLSQARTLMPSSTKPELIQNSRTSQAWPSISSFEANDDSLSSALTEPVSTASKKSGSTADDSRENVVLPSSQPSLSQSTLVGSPASPPLSCSQPSLTELTTPVPCEFIIILFPSNIKSDL